MQATKQSGFKKILHRAGLVGLDEGNQTRHVWEVGADGDGPPGPYGPRCRRLPRNAKAGWDTAKKKKAGWDRVLEATRFRIKPLGSPQIGQITTPSPNYAPAAPAPIPRRRAHRTPPEAKMTTSRRLADRKTSKFQKNITKRGSVPETTVKKGNDYPVGPIVLGFFIFVVIGSSLFQIIRTASSGGMA
ncbi:uncharacterized protein LOC125513955 isoform X1 [Triticum urartu]|uniref:Stress-associated endoplasmic reticulum protein 2 n=1 Tax=Triticum urartu TaxID=4572 RepID=A0A8R7QP34_TRIUA|nr:uncharacterized protein LOC125513955 isoform X1 [Triticum urartu]